MRILHVVPSIAASRGGPTAVAIGLGRALLRAGVAVEILGTRADLDAAGEQAARVALGPVPLTLVAARPGRMEWAPGILPSLWGRLSAVDLVHVHTVYTFAVAAAPLACRARRVPYLVRPAGTLDADCIESRSPRKKKLAIAAYVRRNLDGAAVVQATSEKERRELTTLAPSARVEVIELGVDAPAVAPDGGAPGRRVGSIGRLHPGKRLEVLLSAIAGIPGCELLLAGDGEPAYVGALHQMAAGLGITGRVRWLGQVAAEAKRDFFAACDLLAFPSQHESFGIAVAESLAAGRSVVVSPGIALAAEIERAGAGAIADDEKGFADAIRARLSDGKLRAREAAAGRALAARFGWDEVARKTIARYEAILSRS
jgi:glycosyltransferase involved in cell wall biosynthesis